MTWFTCPKCQVEWNNLTPNGDCIDCVEKVEFHDKRQIALGEYLKKTIGSYGIQNYSFDNFRTDAGNMFALEAIQNFNYAKDNIFLTGPCGTGKTHLAGALIKKSCANNLNVRWENPIYLTRFIKKHFNENEERIIDELIAQDVLIIDDLGIGQDLATILRVLYEICDKRKARMKNGLLITSNLSLEELAQHYKDDRVVSRIVGMCRVVQIMGVDKRVKND